MIKVLGVFFILLFSIENSLADMLSVTTGGHIAASSEVEDTIDNQGATLISSASTQNSKVVGFQESTNITLTTALPAGTVRGNFSSLATDAIAVGTIVNSYIIFLMPRAEQDQVDHRDPAITFQFDPGEKVINVYDDAINDIDSSADSAFEQIEMAGFVSAIGEPGDQSRVIKTDEIVESNPDIIAIICCGYNENENKAYAVKVMQDEKINNLSPFKNKRIFSFDSDALFSRPTLRILEGAKKLRETILSGNEK